MVHKVVWEHKANFVKPVIIFKRACPDIMLANKRIAKLKILDIYEINSMIMRNRPMASGVPLGRNMLKKLLPVFWNPMKFILMKIPKVSVKIKIKELVTVKV